MCPWDLSTVTREYDVIAIGAGPAGCGVARLLAAWGHRVLLIDRPGGDGGGLALSIPPSARRTMAALGMLTAIDEAGFHPWRGNTVWWADRDPRVESFAPGAEGYQVVRDELTRVLRPLAMQSGADVRVGRARKVRLSHLEPTEPPDFTATVLVDTDGKQFHVTALFVLDCSGRSGIVARQGLRRRETSHRTVALVAKWRAEALWAIADETHTLVASYADGWAWSIPAHGGIRYFAVMVDPERTDLARGKPSSEVYLAELAKVRAFQPLLERGTLVDGPWGHDASLYSARQYAGPGFLLVGDAASFIDPLSSFGVKKALASAWVAAVVTHTALVRPEMCGEALAFHERRERSVYASYRRQAARFAADAAGDSDHPFWVARASPSDDTDEIGLGDAALALDPQVLAAFDDLRRRSALRLREGDDVRISPRAAIRGREIVLDDHLILPECADGIRYLRGVDLVALAQLAPRHTDVGELYEACVRTQPSVILPDFLGALSLLIARGVLRHDRD